MKREITILGLESSCDDTAAAIVRCSPNENATVMSSVVSGQTDLHAPYGGVVPEIAARAHAEKLDDCTLQALSRADITLAQVDAIAVTAGPGLIGGVVSGVMFAKALALSSNIPFYGINHLAGHALTPRLTDQVCYPYLMLLVSGGHCQFLMVHGPDNFHRLGGTIDDAPGEAFDKVARLIGLPQPGGPEIEKIAQNGDGTRFSFPRALLDREGCDLSFSGLKTAVRRQRDILIQPNNMLKKGDQADLAASFQAAVSDVLAEKTRRAIANYPDNAPRTLCVAGGVAANSAIRGALKKVASQMDADFVAPPLALCTDNAAMIAYAAAEQMAFREPDDLTLSARPRWPLDTFRPAMLGSGKKGAKA